MFDGPPLPVQLSLLAPLVEKVPGSRIQHSISIGEADGENSRGYGYAYATDLEKSLELLP